MSIKKELLYELSEQQLKELAEIKGVEFTVNEIREKYYADWNEKDKLVDIMTDQKQISIADIEKFISHGKLD
jgi:hypothetical protein